MRGSRARERQEAEEAKKRAAASARQERRRFQQVVQELTSALGEREPRSQAAIERSVAELGIEAAQALYQEVATIEAGGGMMTADGSRRRTPGGVYMLLLKQRLNEAGKKDVLRRIIG